MVSPRTSSSPEQLLRDAGLRITRPRTAVLAALAAHPHSGADAVLDVVRRDLGTVSTQAVYDVLNVLAERGVARRIQPRGSVARYELRTDDNHHHVVCHSCGAVDDVDCATGEAPCLEAATPHGFAIDEAEVTYWGVCPGCQSAAGGAGRANHQGVSNA